MLDKRLPVVGTIRRYEQSWVVPDVLAGLTLAAVLVPMAIGYASLAGAPAVVGLYTALGAMCGYFFFGTSRELNMGPEATVAIVAGTAVAPLAAGDARRHLALLAALAIGAGLVSIAAGFLRLGWITAFLSRPILLGYIVGSGLIIIASQMEDLLGVDALRATTLFGDVADTHAATLLVGVITIVVVAGLRRLGPKVPSYLIGMVAATVVVAVFDLRAEGVAVVGAIEAGLPGVGLPDVTASDVLSLVGPAAAIALLIYGDSMLTEQSLAKTNDYDIDADQEFFALGASNIGSALLGGFPANGSQSRSVVNSSAGAHTQVSNAVAAALVVVVLLFLTPLFDHVPRAALAGVVLVAAAGLIDIPALRRVWVLNRGDFVLAVITAGLVVWVDVLFGILAAVVLSLLDASLKPYRAHTAVLERVPGTSRYRDIEKVEGDHTVPGLLVFRFDAPLYFANASRFLQTVRSLVADADPPLREVMLSAEAVVEVDSTGHERLRELIDELHDSDIRFSVARAKPGFVDAVERSGLAEDIDDFHLEVDLGVESFLQRFPPSNQG